MNSSTPKALVWLSLSLMSIKQYIRIQQLIIASQWLAEGDAAEGSNRQQMLSPKRSGGHEKEICCQFHLL